MIPILLKSKPETFNELVEVPGNEWLKENQILLAGSLPEGTKIPNYWVRVLPDLWNAYGGVCAYYGYFFELASGAQSTDHFAAKSKLPGKAFQWENYRLACLEANRKKHQHSDVLDPMELEEDTFRLDLDEGSIYPNPEKSQELQEKAKLTIDRLDLDESIMRELRARHFHWYKTGEISEERLRKSNPFVFAEALRQNLL